MDTKALQKISYGLYMVSSKYKDRINGQIANTVMQVTSEPRQLAVCVNKNNLTHKYISESGVFVVSVLDTETPMKLIGNFGFKSGKKTNKFKDIKYKKGKTGAPYLLSNTLAYIECKVKGSMAMKSHTMFVGEVIDAEVLKEGKAMTYEFYHQVKNGKEPESAPTYSGAGKEGKVRGGQNNMEKYECTVCGYIYDPAKGDEESGIEPGTSFDDLPDDWVCPVCGVGKDDFEKID